MLEATKKVKFSLPESLNECKVALMIPTTENTFRKQEQSGPTLTQLASNTNGESP